MPLEQFRSAILAAGLNPPDVVVPDGKMHRFASNGKPHDDAGWYVLHGDGIPAGAFGDWRTGISQTWRADVGRPLTTAENAAHRTKVETMRKAREAEETRRQAEAAVKAAVLWGQAHPAPDNHPYLVKKEIKPHGTRLYQGALLIPMRADGKLHSLQFIEANGDKKFLSGGRVRGTYFATGSPAEAKEHGVLCITEGFATAATIREATGLPVVAAFSAGNLEPVARALRAKYPDLCLILSVDDDANTEGNPGKAKATEAAQAVGGLLAIPDFGDSRPEGVTDFNDLARIQGPDAVRRCIENVLQGTETQIVDKRAEASSAIPTESWPTLNPTALHGLAGEVIRLLEPHTEADPVALLVSFLSEIGTMLNRGPHVILDGTYHPLLFWPVIVGRSSKSRKGTADKRIKTICVMADLNWTRGEHKGTLSSGEGLAFAVRDPQYRDEPLKEKGRPTGETVRICVDGGVEDKRLFLVQSEFGSVLRIMARDGNSLSGVLRDAWDGQTLAPMTKANRVRATDPHIGIVGHVTKDELLRNLTDTEASNGFGNRFVWLVVRRSKELPFSSMPDESELDELSSRLGKTVQSARTIGAIGMTPAACEAWKAAYHDLSADRSGLAGSLLGRAEAQVMRLSALYAVLDGHREIDLVHLNAALALWAYAEASTRLIFGDSTGDPIADTILRAVRASGELSDTMISNLFERHVPASKLERAKAVLVVAGLVHAETIESGGRPKRVWKLGAKKAN